MAIKARFNTGEKSITLNALYQWDYGHKLEIEADDISDSVVEVHFSYSVLKDAIVNSCSISGGKGIVPIPNRCFEQSETITAWVYEIEKTNGVITKCTTTKTIIIPVIARLRPAY